MLKVFKQPEIDYSAQSVAYFEFCLNDVAEHMFPKKARQTQKRYICRNLRLAGKMIVKEWVAWVSELNKYLKDFPAQNRNKIQPLDEAKIMDILKYGVQALWCREFTVHGFDPVDQGLKNVWSSVPVWSCVNPAQTNPGPKSPLSPKMLKNVRLMCLLNPLAQQDSQHQGLLQLKRCTKHTKHAKQGEECKDRDKVTYKDLNALVNAKVTTALKKAKKNFKKEKKDKQ
eukprot:15343241-Ditylum_brightwellii.AAC.1